MDDSDDSDSEVEILRKRKSNILEDEESDETDDEESESDGEDESDDSEDNPDDDVTLTDDVSNDQCAICLMEFTDQKLGVPNNCSHVFCLVCLQEWAKNVNTCPVDRKVFYTILVKKVKDGVTIEEIKVEDRTQVKDEEYEDPTTCEICGIGDREDRMLLCDRCDRGFHLECLTPPLDSVPDEEWFCPDCFIRPTIESTQDTVDYSQHAIVFSDDELPAFELQSQPTASSSISSNSRASTSQQRRARTVATSRQRRRRRTTRRRRQTEGQRSKKKTKKTKSSDKGASTTTTRTSKAKKKKPKKRKKSTRKRRRNDENSHQSSARYLLPSEMEPTATFSLFGSDFDLEYLPVIETPTVVSKQSSPSRSSTASNPDVLGSIFTGLNTLHSPSLSVDNQGRVKNEENKSAYESIVKSKIPRTSTQSTSSLGGTLGTSCPKEIPGNNSIHGNAHKHSSSPKTETCNEIEPISRKLINEKRLVRFNTSTNATNFVKPKVDFSSFADSKNLPRKFYPEKITKLQGKEDKPSTSILASAPLPCGLSQVPQLSLTSFKIPKKPTISTSTLTPAMTTDTKSLKTVAKSKSPIKSPLNSSESKIARRKSKVPTVPKESSGILHLLPAVIGRSPEKQTGIRGGGNTSNESRKDGINQSSATRSIVSNTLSVSKTLQRQDERSSECTTKISNSSSTLNSSCNISYENKATASRHSLPIHASSHRQFPSNVNITSTVTDDNSSLDLMSNSSSQNVGHVEPSRPVAVVRPTKIDENNGQVTSSLDTEAAKRRKQGIERLQRRQAICEEVKNALKPFYKHREITKENYKYIFSRAAEKISKSTLPVVSRDVASLVRNYVKKLKGRQSQPTL